MGGESVTTLPPWPLVSTVIVIYTASVFWQVTGKTKQYDPGEIFVHAFYPVVSRQVDRVSCPDPVVVVYWAGGKGGNDGDPCVKNRQYVYLHGVLFLLQFC